MPLIRKKFLLLLWYLFQLKISQGYEYHCVKSVQIRSFFWSVFSRIRTEYGEIFRISLYSVRLRENSDQKKLRIWTLFTQFIFHVILDGSPKILGMQNVSSALKVLSWNLLIAGSFLETSSDSKNIRENLKFWGLIISKAFEGK